MKIKPAATYEQELLTAARAVARLQAKRRSLRKRLKEVEAELRHEKKMLRAVANRNDAPRPDVMPSRLFNGATGYVEKTGTE
jgi:multidrug resistance efflux pump